MIVLYQFKSWGPFLESPENVSGPKRHSIHLRPAYSLKLVFSYVVKGIKIILTAKFRASGRLRFEDTKKTMSPEMRPKSFGTSEKRAPGVRTTTASPASTSCSPQPTRMRYTPLMECEFHDPMTLFSPTSHKASGIDKLSPRMLRLAAPIIAPSIAKLINYSFNTASFPQRWKAAKFFPLFKGGDSEDLNNY